MTTILPSRSSREDPATNCSPSALAAAMRRDGYLVIAGAVDRCRRSEFIDVVAAAVEARARELMRSGAIAESHEDAPFEQRLARVVAGRDPRLRAWNSACFAPALHRLILAPGILEPLAALLGPEIAFNGDYHLRPKLPDSAAGIVPWHQDSQYFGAATAGLAILTVMVALVDTTVENGCLWIAPGSHAWGYEQFTPDTSAEERVRQRAEAAGRRVVPVPLRAGDAVVFPNLTYHGSGINRSCGIRWTIDLRYSAAPGFLHDGEDGPGARFRARLEGIGYTPFLARSSRGPVTTWDEWRDAHRARNPDGLAHLDRFA